jgi:hypothetical protein
MPRPTWSFLHATARLPGWEDSYRAAMIGADRPDEVEYLLCVDSCDADRAPAGPLHDCPLPGCFKVVVNQGQRCSTAAYNVAAQHSTGRVLIVAQDDVTPPVGWDSELDSLLMGPEVNYDGEWVLWVRCGNPRDHELMGPQILSRKRYERVGWIWYPEYQAMFADDEFTQSALADGVVIDGRDRLSVWYQKHPAYDSRASWDAVYAHENNPDNYEIGHGIFTRRKAQGFPKRVVERRRINVCLPGESFSHHWMAAWTQSVSWLTANHEPHVFFGHCTDVYQCRNDFSRRVLEQGSDAELTLWIDDDNPLPPEALLRLMAALDSHPEASAVAAWCLIWDEVNGSLMVSCGGFRAVDGWLQTVPADPRGWMGRVEPYWYSGFPAVLMRTQLLRDLGPEPFKPYFGLKGEDVAFWKRAEEAGKQLLVHTGIELTHLKLQGLKADLSRFKATTKQ